MLNVEIDPRGGIFSRAGYQKKNTTEVSVGGVWKPKTLYSYKYPTDPQIMLSTGYDTATSTNGSIYKSTGNDFSTLDTALATPLVVRNADGASFTQWESILYMAVGIESANMYKWTVSNTYATALTASSPIWQPYAVPTGGYMPRAKIALAHANKMFVANTYEYNDDATPSLTAYPNRLRWSHENLPEDWFIDDYIDIVAGGEGIRGVQIVDGQLLIFKPKAVYLLMGYDADNFQLVELSTNIGIEHPQQCVAGSGGVYFFDYPGGLFFYNRNGIQDIFERIRPIITKNEINHNYLQDIVLSYINKRVWISLPYSKGTETIAEYPTVNLIFDPTIGQNGAYTMFQTAGAELSAVKIAGYGLVSGCDWHDSTNKAFHLMTSFDPNYRHVYFVDDYEYDLDDVPVGIAVTLDGKFNTLYRTNWFDDNRYVQLKTFIRPYFVLKEVAANTQLSMLTFKNFDESNTFGKKTISLVPIVTGGVYGTGRYGIATYGQDTVGAVIKRRGVAPLGRAFAIQLEFQGPSTITGVGFPGRKWGLNSIAYKWKPRKVRST